MAEQEMASLLKSPLPEGIPHESLLERGELWSTLSELITKSESDLIVVGTRGRGITKLLLGSVAEEIVRMASCPVLTVGPAVRPKVVPEERLNQILYATDFQPASMCALEYALSLADENWAALAMLHVVEVPDEAVLDVAHASRANLIRKLAELIPPDRSLACQPKFLVEFGEPAKIIVQVAAEKQADLIVMGARQTLHPHLSSHLAWGMAHRVLTHAECPVLTVRG